MPLLASIEDFCLTHGLHNTYWVAYSGGLDSHVLLHSLVQLRSVHPIRLKAIYVNHGLSPHATAWGKHCAHICTALQVELIQQRINAKASSGNSPEEVARDKRYELFSQLLAEGDYLLTAHHQDDQAETLLVQMLRGAGPKGLSAMPTSKPLGHGILARPLLTLTRADLKNYAEQNQLQWIDDESNIQVNFARNFLRHEVLPILKKRWPTVTATLARVATNCAETQQLLEILAAQDLQTTQGKIAGTLSLSALRQFDPIRQRHILRAWLKAQNYPAPSSLKLQHIQQDMLAARHDRMPCVSWDTVEIRRFQDHLYALPLLSAHDSQQILLWEIQHPLTIRNLGMLRAIPTIGKGLRADLTSITVRFRQGGERCRLPGRNYHQQLKKLFQVWGVPLWQRDRIPLLYVHEELVAVVGFYIDEKLAAGKDELGYVLQFDN